MAAVSTIFVAESSRLTAGVAEQVHFAEVVSRNQQVPIVRAGHSIDVCAVCPLRPDPKNSKTQHTSSSSPLHISHGVCTGDLLTGGSVPVQNFVVSRVGDKAGAVLGPIQVSDKTGMALVKS